MVKLPFANPLYAFWMASMDVPILFALSDISVMAMSAILADLAVSPSKLCNKDAEKLVTVSIY